MRAPHPGEAEIAVGAETVRLRYDWRALSALEARFGKGWDAAIEDAFGRMDAAAVADVLAAGSDRAADWWLDRSPPLIPAIVATRAALLAAFYGPGDPEPADPRTAASRKRRTLSAWFAALSALGRRSAETPKPSGG